MGIPIFWQGKKASNPRPTVLETVALPTELFPYIQKFIKTNRRIRFGKEEGIKGYGIFSGTE